MYTGNAGGNGYWLDGKFPRITQDGRDGDEEPGYIMNLTDTATCGFKYFRFEGLRRITVRMRGYAWGYLSVRTAWDGPELAKIREGAEGSGEDASGTGNVKEGDLAT